MLVMTFNNLDIKISSSTADIFFVSNVNKFKPKLMFPARIITMSFESFLIHPNDQHPFLLCQLHEQFPLLQLI